MFLPLLGQRGLKGEGMGLGTSCFACCAEVALQRGEKRGRAQGGAKEKGALACARLCSLVLASDLLACARL